MINVEVTEKSIKELVDERTVSVVIQGCNCFHTTTGVISDSLRDLTSGDIDRVDAEGSVRGDINKLGNWTSELYTLAGQEVEIYNLYCEFIHLDLLFVVEQESIHWSSVYDGIEKILSKCESGTVVAVGMVGYTDTQQETFQETLEELAKENDNELPDVDIIIFER